MSGESRLPAVDVPPTGRTGARARRALVFSFLNTFVGRLGTLISGILLARILVPEDFGTFAVALVALNGLLAINELGVSLALVRWPGDPREIAPTVTSLSIGSSLLIYSLCFFGAPVYAAAMGVPDASGVVRLLCVAVVVDGLTAAPAQFVNREFRQEIRLVVDLANLTLSTGITIGLALSGIGAWALAWGRLVGSVLSALLLFRLADAWPRPGWDRRHVGPLLRFGLPLAGASLLLFGMLNVDFVVAGPLLGATALGLYLQAFNLAAWPVNVFSSVVRRVSLAAFSRVADDPDTRHRMLAKLAAGLAAVTMPSCALLGLLALPLVTTVYGAAWAGSAAALQFLAVTAVVRVAGELSYDYLIALDRPSTAMALQGTWLIALAVVLPVGTLLGGLQGLAAANALVAVVVVLPAYATALVRCGVPLGLLGRSVLRPVLGCAALVAAVLVLRALLPPSPVQLLVGGAVGVLIYLPIVWPMRDQLQRRGRHARR